MRQKIYVNCSYLNLDSINCCFSSLSLESELQYGCLTLIVIDHRFASNILSMPDLAKDSRFIFLSLTRPKVSSFHFLAIIKAFRLQKFESVGCTHFEKFKTESERNESGTAFGFVVYLFCVYVRHTILRIELR